MPHIITLVKERPKCDFCDCPAIYDGKTEEGRWAYMCDKHFAVYGIGLGDGKGQILMVPKSTRKHTNRKEADS